MKYINSVIFLLLFICSLNAVEVSSYEREQINYLSQTHRAFQSKKSHQIWPNFNLHELPSVIYFKEGNLFSFYLKGNSNWSPYMDQSEVLVTDQDKWGVTKVMMHPGFQIEDQTAFIFAYGEHADSPINLPILTFVHERFHLHQFDNFEQKVKQAQYVDEWDMDNQVLINIENWLLTQFFLEEDSNTKIELLKDFMAVNHQRQQVLQPSSISWEDMQQQMEGLADYVSIKTFEVFSIFPGFSSEKAIVQLRENKTGKNYSYINDAIKSRHYFVGSALGFALDFCQADWKKDAERGVPLRVLLLKALSMSQQDLEARFQEIKKTDEFNFIKEKVTEDLTKEKGDLDNLVKKYDELEGVCIHLKRPNQPISGGGKNVKTYHIGDGNTLALTDTSFSSSSDQAWRLRFTSMPYIFEDRRGDRSFKLSQESEFTIDGKVLRKEEIQELHFKTLSVKDEHCEFITEMPGEIYQENGKIIIDFEN